MQLHIRLSEITIVSTKDNTKIKLGAPAKIIPARRGLFLDEVFRLSDILLLDEDDLVQKGYGWMLKEEIFDYIMKNKTMMPRTALRYAIEKMPGHLHKKAMER